jgi:predicted metalloprotease with PDZ domain
MENIIRSLDPGSPLEGRAHAGDRLVSINGHVIRDVLDHESIKAYKAKLARKTELHKREIAAAKAEAEAKARAEEADPPSV